MMGVNLLSCPVSTFGDEALSVEQSSKGKLQPCTSDQ